MHLRHWHSERPSEKNNNFLISPAIFDPDHPNREPGKRRGLRNIVYLLNLWMDFENGNLRPEEVAELFPNIRLIVFNSYSHTNDKPRFRVLVPLTRPLTCDAYEALWDIIAKKIEDAGYQVWERKRRQKGQTDIRLRSGLDRSKRAAASLFYLPCQAELGR
jgi:hypothetical protein